MTVNVDTLVETANAGIGSVSTTRIQEARNAVRDLAARARERDRLRTWQQAYAKGREGLVAQADQDFARAETAVAELEDARADAAANYRLFLRTQKIAREAETDRDQWKAYALSDLANGPWPDGIERDPERLARRVAELERLLHGPDRVGQMWKRVAELEAARNRIGEFAASHSGNDSAAVLLAALYRIAEECEALAGDGGAERATICEECGSGILDGKHIADYPCSRRAGDGGGA